MSYRVTLNTETCSIPTLLEDSAEHAACKLQYSSCPDYSGLVIVPKHIPEYDQHRHGLIYLVKDMPEEIIMLLSLKGIPVIPASNGITSMSDFYIPVETAMASLLQQKWNIGRR